MKISVLIPTYRHPHDLMACLRSLIKQDRKPDEIMVVVRESDTETQDALNQFRDFLTYYSVNHRLSANLNNLLKIAYVSIGGQVAALNAGLAAVSGDIISITDDDAVPHRHWLARIEAHFLADSRIGGVGGRDWLYFGPELQAGERSTVGRLRWFGARIGNHHLGAGQARSVEILKGANMSYRREAIADLAFDTNLRGKGAQIYNDLAFSLSVKKAGWTLIYDPEVSIDHNAAPKFNEGQRNQFNSVAFLNAVHNETLSILNYLPAINRYPFLLWAIFVGNRQAFGFVQILRFLPKEGTFALHKWWLSIQGRWQGYRTWLASHPKKMIVMSNNLELG